MRIAIFIRNNNWRAGASQPSRTTGTIFLYIYIFIYMYRRAGAHRTYAHARKLRETPTRHLYIPFALCHRANQMQSSVVS